MNKNVLPLAGEQNRIRQVFKDVAARVGLGHIQVEIMSGPEHGDTGDCVCGKCESTMSSAERPNMGITQNKRNPNLYRLVYSPNITTHFDTWMLAGTIAHELGHVALGHIGKANQRYEFEADAYAAQHGFRDALRRVLEFNAAQNPVTSWLPSNHHPAVQERIWRLAQSERRAA